MIDKHFGAEVKVGHSGLFFCRREGNAWQQGPFKFLQVRTRGCKVVGLRCEIHFLVEFLKRNNVINLNVNNSPLIKILPKRLITCLDLFCGF